MGSAVIGFMMTNNSISHKEITIVKEADFNPVDNPRIYQHDNKL